MLPLQARITRLHEHLDSPRPLLPNMKQRELWVLRDDELGGLWGTKFRKYASIISYCRLHRIDDVIATGGMNSNNLAAASVLLREHGLNLHAFAIQDHSDEAGTVTGNRMIIRATIPASRLFVVPRPQKATVSDLMRQHASLLQNSNKRTLILEEGGGCVPAVPGCLTLADDIMRPRIEWQDGEPPDHIFIDSGTALSAASLAAALKLKNLEAKTKLHIIQMAGFDEQIANAFAQWVHPATGVRWQDVQDFTRVYRPMSPRSYGATSSELFQFIRDMAQQHGLLLDPVYTAKSFMRSFDLIQGQNLKGRILIIHTGGVTGLMGYNLIDQ